MLEKTQEAKEQKVLFDRREDIIWEKNHERMQLSDRAAIDIGLGALKSAIFMNAGALVALIAFVAQIWGKKNGDKLIKVIFESAHTFTYGLILGGAAFVIAYFYQSIVTTSFEHHLKKIPLFREPIPRKITWLSWATRVLMVILAIASLGAFAKGSMDVLGIFDGVSVSTNKL
jgi:hypothetical protein